eukprot:TRINITY_DN1851_c0_g1_i2.p1 TRINITY_DN1851_c0_g1~~TRINITY_DN1851_c0_g1_i2.p1  ORF type:complete len:429 (+),score=188.61 TRINITY_DN1851_c0_g1_i2:69-1289(+)
MAEGTKVCVCGGGNAAHVMVGDLGSRGYKVSLYAPFTPPGGVSEAEKFLGSMPEEGIEITYVNEDGRKASARPAVVSKDPKEAVAGCKFIFIPLPVFAHRPTLMDIVPHVDDGTCIIAMPATGCFDWTGTQVLRELGRDKSGIVLCGVAPLPYVCRITDYAKKVNLMGIKDSVGLATLPSGQVDSVATQVEKIINLRLGAERYPSFLPITLTPTNPIMHTGRCYGLFGPHAAQKEYSRMIRFYDECDDVSNEWLHKLNDENQKIAAACDEAFKGSIGGKVKNINEYLKWCYGPDISKWDTCGDCYRTNKQFAGVGSPMKEVSEGKWAPDFANRYFTEDFPFGILANRGLAELLGVPTPHMDEVILWAQDNMGKKWLVDGKLNPDEKPQMTPQAFKFSVEDLRSMYS